MSVRAAAENGAEESEERLVGIFVRGPLAGDEFSKVFIIVDVFELEWHDDCEGQKFSAIKRFSAGSRVIVVACCRLLERCRT